MTVQELRALLRRSNPRAEVVMPDGFGVRAVAVDDVQPGLWYDRRHGGDGEFEPTRHAVLRNAVCLLPAEAEAGSCRPA